MISFFLPFLVFSKAKYTYPKFTKLYVGPGYTHKEINDYFNWITGDKPRMCRDNEADQDNTNDFISYDDCIDELNSIVSYKYIPGPDINQALKEISTVSEVLYIEGSGFDNIDLNNLRDTMKVLIYYNYYDPSQNAENAFKKTNKFHVHPFYEKRKGLQKLSLKSNIPAISFNGDIKNKVSYFGISSALLNLTSELNVDNILWYSELAENSKKIKTKLFASRLEKPVDYVETEQYGYYNTYGYFYVKRSMDKSIITYCNDSWKIAHYEDDGRARDTFVLSYSSAPMFNPFFDIGNIEIVLDPDANIESFPPINISLMEYTSISDALNDRKRFYYGNISIKCTGWSRIDESKRPKVILTYDSDMFSYSPKELDLKIQVEEPFQYELLNRKDGNGGGSSGKGGGKGKGGNTGMIVGIVIGVVVVVAIIIVVVIIVIRKKKSNQQSKSEGEDNNQQEEK